MLGFGICDTIGSLLFGILGKYTGRVPLFLLGTLLNLGTICLMKFWMMTDYASSVLFFIIPSLWGICDAIWLTQSQGKYIFSLMARCTRYNIRFAGDLRQEGGFLLVLLYLKYC
jgi:predicted MFS family arabinose efflux permease